MNREEVLKLLKENLSNQNLIKHSFAVEAIMRALARRFGADVEKWGLVGLLHDIDYEGEIPFCCGPWFYLQRKLLI